MNRAILVLAVVCALIVFSGVSQAIEMEMVTVRNATNAADDTGYGSVNHEYQIGKYEVTAGQYTEFLNAVAVTDTYVLFYWNMDDFIGEGGDGCNIVQSGSNGSYTYSVEPSWANRPVNYVNWYNALRFCNWLHNGQPTGEQTVATTENGAYDMSLGSSVVRKPDALYFLPSEDEWYKAAYHKNDGPTDNYFDYPTSSDIFSGGATLGGGAGNPYFRTEVGYHLNYPSPYGTFDMGGNVAEYAETLNPALVRGGGFGGLSQHIVAWSRGGTSPSNSNVSDIGFRVAAPVLISIIDTDTVISDGDIYDTVVVTGDGTTVTMTGGDVYRIKITDASTVNISGGSIAEIYSYSSSICNLSGGFVNEIKSYSQSEVNIMGNATIDKAHSYGHTIASLSSINAYVGDMKLYNGSTFSFSDGTIDDLWIYQDSILNISGGIFSNSLNAINNEASISQVNIYGGIIPLINVEDGASKITVYGGTINEMRATYIKYPTNSTMNFVGYNLEARPYDGIKDFGLVTGFWNDDSSFATNLGSAESYVHIVLYDGVLPVNCVNPPESDISDDCKVNSIDLAKMASEWLIDGTE